MPTDLPGNLTSDALLRVRDLRVHFPTPDGLVRSVDGLSFDVRPGEILGVVGESGSGKSVTGKAIIGLHDGSRLRPARARLVRGPATRRRREEELRRLRGSKIAMIFQEPMTSLQPVLHDR